MKVISLLFCLLISNFSFATNYYVSALIGSDSYNGTTPTTPFYSLQKAADFTNPGDSVFVMNGTYTNSNPNSNVVGIYNSGTATNFITYKNYLNHNPVIQLASNNWSGIAIQGADYIIIDGIKVIGDNDSITLAYAQSQQNNTNNPATSGNGIGCASEYGNPSNKPHHITIQNCTVSKCGGGGIYSYNADYFTVKNNIVFECGWYSPYGNSGISLYQNWNSDTSTEIKNFVVENTCYRNENYVPFFAAGSITDGNGIIIDDSRNTQNNSTLGVYLGKTLVANNLVFDNGARGIHCYESDNVLVVNNTSYKNCQSSSTQEGELTAFSSGTITFLNNIAFPDASIPPIASFNAPNLIVSYNLWCQNYNLANPIGTNYLTGNPNFVLESSNPNLANFQLQNSSIAINSGTLLNAPTLDKIGNPRIGAVDIGAYENQNILNTLNYDYTIIKVVPNPTSSLITIQLSENISKDFIIFISNSLGQNIETIKKNSMNGKISIDLNSLSSGVYFISLNDKKFKSIKIIKI